jgi:hypothetical protein
MNTLGFDGGVEAAELDLAEGWFPENENLDSIVNQLRVMTGSSDAFIAGYLSVIYRRK